MTHYFSLHQGRWQLAVEGDNYQAARHIAAQCQHFIADDEDEQVDDQLRSCVNCARRRWLVGAIECTALSVRPV